MKPEIRETKLALMAGCVSSAAGEIETAIDCSEELAELEIGYALKNLLRETKAALRRAQELAEAAAWHTKAMRAHADD